MAKVGVCRCSAVNWRLLEDPVKRRLRMAEDFDLERFLEAQSGGVYEKARQELENGGKRSHWMWFVFPQLKGLGFSEASRYYGLRNEAEARAFLADKVLGARLRELCEILLALPASNANAVFGYPDDLKLRSSMTLFDYVAPGDVFGKVLEKFFAGGRDAKSHEMLAQGND